MNVAMPLNLLRPDNWINLFYVQNSTKKAIVNQVMISSVDIQYIYSMLKRCNNLLSVEIRVNVTICFSSQVKFIDVS